MSMSGRSRQSGASGSGRSSSGRSGGGWGGGGGGGGGGPAAGRRTPPSGRRGAERGVPAGPRPGTIRAWGVEAEMAPARQVSPDLDFGPEDDDDDFGPGGERDSLVDVPGG